MKKYFLRTSVCETICLLNKRSHFKRTSGRVGWIVLFNSHFFGQKIFSLPTPFTIWNWDAFLPTQTLTPPPHPQKTNTGKSNPAEKWLSKIHKICSNRDWHCLACFLMGPGCLAGFPKKFTFGEQLMKRICVCCRLNLSTCKPLFNHQNSRAPLTMSTKFWDTFFYILSSV